MGLLVAAPSGGRTVHEAWTVCGHLVVPASKTVNRRIGFREIISGSRLETSKSDTLVYARAFSSLLCGFLSGVVNHYVCFELFDRGGAWISRNRADNLVYTRETSVVGSNM